MKPSDIDVDDFLEFVGDFNSAWTDDHRGIVLSTPRDKKNKKNKAYRVAAYLVDRSFPSLVITFHEHMADQERSQIYNHVRNSIRKLEVSFGAEVRVSWRQRTIRITRRKPIQWPSETASQVDYVHSSGAAKRWYRQTRREFEHLINHIPEPVAAPRRSSTATAKMISRTPPPISSPKRRKSDNSSAFAWPIPLTPASPRNGTAASAALTVPQFKEPDFSRASAAKAPGDASKPFPKLKQRICPICNKPTSAGLLRHQQCERRAVASPAPKPVVTPANPKGRTPDASSEYQRLVRKVEQREASTYGKRRDTVRQDPVRMEEARKAVLLRSQGHCENPKCGGEPNDITDDGRPILEVDHVDRIAEGGRDHPVQMVALCPNCHAMKERGSNRRALQAALRDVAARAHRRWNSSKS